MILNNQIIGMIKAKSRLSFDKAKDYNSLCDLIFTATNSCHQFQSTYSLLLRKANQRGQEEASCTQQCQEQTSAYSHGNGQKQAGLQPYL